MNAINAIGGASVRRAGICVPLFSLRSRQGWGLGEILDIPPAVQWLRAARQTLLQILPLNELAPGESSPYSALSAMAIDPRFISIRYIPDAPDFEALWPAEIAAVRQAPVIAYDRISALKNIALRICFERFCENDWEEHTPRAEALRDYVRRESWWIDEYALYRALRAQSGERPWTEWPAALRDRDPGALLAAQRQLEQEILFYQYVQWTAAEQWQAVRRATGAVEILGDFPFMVTLDSADVWSRQREFLLDASVGTPPDAFSETGQEWGLPPYNWDEAAKNNFEWLRMRARRMADLYGGFRVDHLVGFYRTYVRPLDGSTPYFSPAVEDEQVALGEAIMRMIMDAGAHVSVEDLGTVPDFVRESVSRLGLPGYRVVRWEPDDPGTYPQMSVAMTGTHDTEPLAAWWDTLPDETRVLFARMASINVDPAATFSNAVRDAILKAVYNSPSELALIPIQDVFGWRDRINHPATIGEWNWTYVLPWPIDLVTAQPDAAEAAQRIGRLCSEAGR
jgi:4-alpha-glucanotransferase